MVCSNWPPTLFLPASFSNCPAPTLHGLPCLDCAFRRFKTVGWGRRHQDMLLVARCTLTACSRGDSVRFLPQLPLTHVWETTCKFLWACSFFPLEKVAFHSLPPTVWSGCEQECGKVLQRTHMSLVWSKVLFNVNNIIIVIRARLYEWKVDICIVSSKIKNLFSFVYSI